MLKDLSADRIEPLCGYGVVLELSSRRCCRIEDRLREDTLPLRKRRNHAESSHAGTQARALPIAEEEGFVGLDRSTDGHTVLIATELRFGPGLGKQVSRIERFVP